MKQGLTADSAAQHKWMTVTPVPRLVTLLAIPTVISQLITVIYNTADTYFVARISTSASAAVGVVFSVMSVIQAVGFGIGMGANSIIARRLGEKKDDDAHKYASSALFAACLAGCVVMVFGLLFLQPVLRFVGATETILPYACSYARFILMGAPLMCCAFVLSNVLRAQGETLFAMWGLCCGGLLNVILDPLFIFQLNMGISGASLATVVSQIAAFAVLAGFFLRGKSIVNLNFRYISGKLDDYLLILRVGSPTFFRQGMGCLATALMNIAAAQYGDAAVAAITIANKIYMIFRGIVIGIGQGFQPAAGYNFGAKLFGRVREAFRFSSWAGTVLCTINAILLGVFSDSVIRWFLDDPDVVKIGVPALIWLCAVLPLMAYSTFVNMLYQCLGFSTGATILASCRQGIFFIPLLFILPPLAHLNGLIFVQPAADVLTFVISIPFQIWFFRKVLVQK